MMKTPLSTYEQSNLQAKGILASDETAYKENGLVFAENVLSGQKRVINTLEVVRESKNLLLG